MLNESVSYFLSKNLADVGVRAGFFLEVKEFSSVAYTNPISIYFFQIAQFLKEPTALDRSDLASFLVENKLLLFFVAIGYLVPLFVVFFSRLLLVRFRRHLVATLRSSARFFFLNNTRMRRLSPKYARIFAFFGFFLFIMRTVITNMINTNAVVLDTGQFINSRQRLFDSPKMMVVCGNPIRTNSDSISSTEPTFTYKLFSQKARENRLLEICFSKENHRKLNEDARKKGGLTSMFFYMTQVHGIYFLAPFATGKGSLFAYLDPTSYNTDSVALMIRRNLDSPRKEAAIRR